MKNLIKVSSFIFILVVFISCHKDQTTTPIVYTDQGNIGIQGGTVKTADGASVEIPAGALSTNQTISIDNVTSSLQKFNTGCRIYEMNPDGLTFSDSITIKLPFNNSNLNQNSSDKNYGVRVMVYYKDEWDILPSVVDLKNNSVSVKSKHFSKYAVSYSSDLTDFFINKQKSPGKVLNVPYYFQAGGWCAYYSTSMVSIYSGYDYKPPFFASIIGKPLEKGLNPNEFEAYDNQINLLGINTERAVPAWSNTYDAFGYIIKKIDAGFPVWIASNLQEHAFVVTGYNATGFIINDPSGVFVKACTGSFSVVKLANITISYDNFNNALINFFNMSTPVYTLVITSKGPYKSNDAFVNIMPQFFDVQNSSNTSIGGLQFDGKYKPNGYKLINNNIGDNSFNGSDHFLILPFFSNINQNANISAKLHYEIDKNEVKNSPISISIPKGNTQFIDGMTGYTGKIELQLSGIAKGSHTLLVDLRSQDSTTRYDSWSFDFIINTPLISSSVTTTPITIFSSTSATVGGNITNDGGALITDRGVLWGTSPNPETTGTKFQIGSGIGVFSTSLSGLTPNTLYYVKAYAINSQGTSFGNQVMFTTQPGSQTGTVTDIDGNVYHTVTIGSQVWMKENLKVTSYQDGSTIPNVTDINSWSGLSTGAYFWYDYDIANKDKYGVLYNSYAMLDSRKICPTGWHVPSKTEYDVLLSNESYTSLIGGGSSGFDALFGGRSANVFDGIGIRTNIWSTSPYDGGRPAAPTGSKWDLDIYQPAGTAMMYFFGPNYGAYIRCLQGD